MIEAEELIPPYRSKEKKQPGNRRRVVRAAKRERAIEVSPKFKHGDTPQIVALRIVDESLKKLKRGANKDGTNRPLKEQRIVEKSLKEGPCAHCAALSANIDTKTFGCSAGRLFLQARAAEAYSIGDQRITCRKSVSITKQTEVVIEKDNIYRRHDR